jgi:Protein of unknown function (DUF3618)
MPTEAEDQSLSELEREAERTRAGLIHTVDELHNRVSPQAIKQEMRSYAREASQDLIHNLPICSGGRKRIRYKPSPWRPGLPTPRGDFSPIFQHPFC